MLLLAVAHMPCPSRTGLGLGSGLWCLCLGLGLDLDLGSGLWCLCLGLGLGLGLGPQRRRRRLVHSFLCSCSARVPVCRPLVQPCVLPLLQALAQVLLPLAVLVLAARQCRTGWRLMLLPPFTQRSRTLPSRRASVHRQLPLTRTLQLRARHIWSG